MTYRYETIPVTSGPNATLVAPAGEPYLLFNADENNNVFICDSHSPNLAGPGTIILRPLGTLSVTGAIDTYAITSPGITVLIEASAFATQQTPAPIDIAEQLSGIGIPPIDNPTAVEIVFNQSILAGATYTSPRMSFKQYQSYFGTLFCTFSSVTSNVEPFCQIEWQHSVASDNYDPLRMEDWYVPTTPFNFTYNYRNDLAGFIIGDTITLVVTNLDTTEPVSLTYGLFGSYRTRSRTQMRGRYFAGSPNPSFGLGSDSVIGYLQFVALANNTATAAQLMNLYEGTVTVSGQMSAGGGAGSGTFVIIQVQPSAAFNEYIAIPVPTSGILAPVTVALPRHVCTISVQNGSGANINGEVIVTAATPNE